MPPLLTRYLLLSVDDELLELLVRHLFDVLATDVADHAPEDILRESLLESLHVLDELLPLRVLPVMALVSRLIAGLHAAARGLLAMLGRTVLAVHDVLPRRLAGFQRVVDLAQVHELC